MNTHPLSLLAQQPAPAAGTPSTAAPGAPSPEAAQEPQGSSFMTMILFFGLTLAVMYFLMIRPQQKKEKELRAMVDRLKKNDKVVLQGGIFGVVAQVREKDVIIKIDEKQDVRIRVLRSAVIGVEGARGDGGASKEIEDKKEEEKSEKGA